MADQKITALTALTTPAVVDLLPIVDDPSGTPITKKITLSDLMKMRTTVVPIHSDGSAAITMTNQANSEQFLGNSNRIITKVDLTHYTQVRLITRVVTGSASANSPRVYAEYHTAFSTTIGNYVGIGTSTVNCSLTSTGLIDSGWIDLADGAKADVFIAVLQNGGDATADPAVGGVYLHFR